MHYHLEWKPYRRPFRTPLTTAQGVWRERHGILLRLEAVDGRCGYGEICPMEAFGTESLEAALQLLQSLDKPYGGFKAGQIPAGYPATEMGLWFAERMLVVEKTPTEKFAVSGLLPAGETALEEVRLLRERGFRTFKWKVGVYSHEEEIGWLNLLVELLPPRGKLRLDANQGLDRHGFSAWLDRLEAIPQVEFFEEPLPEIDRNWMRDEALSCGVEVALDESVSQMDSIWKALLSGWRGLLVIKPSIVGSPHQYVQWQGQWERDVVFSSAFETAIGMECNLRLIAAIPEGRRIRPLGFGTNGFFPDDGLSLHGTGPEMRVGKVGPEAMEGIWQML